MAIGQVKQTGKVGVMIPGHREYWPQFPGQREAELKSAELFENLLEECGVEVIRYFADDGTQMIDTPEKAFEAGIFFKKNDIDLCFIYLPSYVASGRWMIGAKQVCCPIVLVGHQVQYEIGQIPITEAIGFGGPCCVTEAYNALERCGIEAKDFVFGRQSGKWFDTDMTKQINEWCRVADALRAYKGAIFGQLGHIYEGMLDMNFDPTTFTRSFGVHIRMLEMCELVEYVQSASKAEIKEKMDEMNETFEYLDPSYDSTTVAINPEDIEWAAQCAVGLDKLVHNNNLSAMAYYYEGRDNYYERVASNLIIGNSLLVSKGIALAGECDMKTCLAMYTTSAIGAGGSFAEYGIDLADNIMLVGHDGPHDIRISDGKPTIRGLGLYHGKRGHGISVEFSLKTGPITMLGLSARYQRPVPFHRRGGGKRAGAPAADGQLHDAERASPEASRGYMVDWAKAGNTHHMSLCLGQQTGVIEKLCKALPDVTFRKVE